MRYFSLPSSGESILYVISRTGLCMIVLLAYLYLLRPARISFARNVAHPQLESMEGESPVFDTKFKGGSLMVSYTFGDQPRALSYRPEGGFFFLVTLMALLFLTFQPRYFLMLLGLHIGASALGYLLLLLGASGYPGGFIFLNLIGSYLTPALSLALVPLVMNKRIWFGDRGAEDQKPDG